MRTCRWVKKEDFLCSLFIFWQNVAVLLLRTPPDISSLVASILSLPPRPSHTVSAFQYRLGHALIHHINNHIRQKPQGRLMHCQGQSLRHERRRHSLGMYYGFVLCIRTVRLRVHSLIPCESKYYGVLYTAMPTFFRVNQSNSMQPHICGYNVVKHRVPRRPRSIRQY